MNTLPHSIKSQLFSSKSAYLGLRQHWSTLMNSERKHELSAGHHLLYLILLGRDWRRGFAPVTNRRHLANGAFADWHLFYAMRALHSPVYEAWLLEPFGEWVTPEMLALVRQWVPKTHSSILKAEDFLEGSYPFDAYEITIDEVESMQ